MKSFRLVIGGLLFASSLPLLSLLLAAALAKMLGAESVWFVRKHIAR